MVSARACVAALTHSNYTRTDLDSHADAPCLGSNALIIYETMRTAHVTAFVNSIGRIDKVPIVHGALAYDCPFSGKVYILVVHHGLHFPEMEHNLIPPFQMRVNDLIIDECPKFLSVEASDKSHSIYFPSENVG
jgi:hypothetical protein